MHLAHSLIRYLGLSSPADLAPFGISSPGDLVDLLSRVRSSSIQYALTLTLIRCVVLNKHNYAFDSFANTDWSCCFTTGCVVQPFLRSKRCSCLSNHPSRKTYPAQSTCDCSARYHARRGGKILYFAICRPSNRLLAVPDYHNIYRYYIAYRNTAIVTARDVPLYLPMQPM